MRLRIGTRGSALALAQTEIVAGHLDLAFGSELEAEVVVIRTTGDRVTDRPFSQIGPKGLFAVQLQRALIEDRIDIAIHSLKDLAVTEPDGLVIVAVPEREDPRDVLVSRRGLALEQLPAGSRVGTSSERRRALVAHMRPDVELVELRGNVDTRLEKVARGDADAAVLAAAGLVRLGRTDAVTQWLDAATFVPSPGQGAIAIEALAARAAGDLAWLRRAEHGPTRAAIDAEQELTRLIEGGCTLPLGVWARYVGAELVLDAVIASPDGSRVVRAKGTDPASVAAELIALGGPDLLG